MRAMSPVCPWRIEMRPAISKAAGTEPRSGDVRGAGAAQPASASARRRRSAIRA
jgi:hypothetical protein